jgi:hypothetical protein
MNNTIYIKGDSGFKSVILTKMGGAWIHGIDDSYESVLGFFIPENILLKDFEKTIGRGIIDSYNLQFLDKLPADLFSETPPKFLPGRPVKMTIWANKNYDLTKLKGV